MMVQVKKLTDTRRDILDKQDAINRKHFEDLTDSHIKKLAVTSGLYDCITDPYDSLKNGDQHSSVMPDLVKFAELIIQECCDQVICREAEYIKNHFGI